MRPGTSKVDEQTQVRRAVARLLSDAGIELSGQRVVCMCSGGVDSVVLTDVLAMLPRGRRPRDLVVLFLDHGTRDVHGEHHAARLVARRHGAAFETVVAPAGAFRSNLQAEARRWRYEMAARVAQTGQAAYVATGHHADDQLETMLYGLVASSGLRSLHGMSVARSLPGGATLVRPLLAHARETIEGYARARRLRWCDDPTNRTLDYARNRIRHEIVPSLLELHPGAGPNLSRTHRMLEQVDNAMTGLAQFVLDSACDERGRCDIRVVRQLPQGARDAVLAQWLRDRGLGRSVTERAVRQVADLLEPASAGRGGTREVAFARACVVRGRYHLTLEHT